MGTTVVAVLWFVVGIVTAVGALMLIRLHASVRDAARALSELRSRVSRLEIAAVGRGHANNAPARGGQELEPWEG